MNKLIFLILFFFSFQSFAQNTPKGGGFYFLTSEPTLSLEKKNYSNVVTFNESYTDKKQRLGIGTYSIGTGKFFAWEGGFFYMPYSHYADTKVWSLSTTVLMRLLLFFPFNIGSGFYYGIGSSKYSKTIFHSGSLFQ